MNDQLQKVLADLATKFGTSVEHLWAVLVYQSRIEVICDLIYYAILSVCGIVLYKFHVKFSKEYKPDDYHRTSTHYDDSETTGIVMIILALAWLVFFLICLFQVGNTITAALNPQYWALKQIFNK